MTTRLFSLRNLLSSINRCDRSRIVRDTALARHRLRMEGGKQPAKPTTATVLAPPAIKQSGKLTVATAAVGIPSGRPGPYTTGRSGSDSRSSQRSRDGEPQLTALANAVVHASASMRGSPLICKAPVGSGAADRPIFQWPHPRHLRLCEPRLRGRRIAGPAANAAGPTSKCARRKLRQRHGAVQIACGRGLSHSKARSGRVLYFRYEPWLKPVAQRAVRFHHPATGPIVPRAIRAASATSPTSRPPGRLINRQRGSGTRILLEKMLADAGVDKEPDQRLPHGRIHTFAARRRSPAVSPMSASHRGRRRRLMLDSSRCSARTITCFLQARDLEREDIREIAGGA